MIEASALFNNENSADEISSGETTSTRIFFSRVTINDLDKDLELEAYLFRPFNCQRH